MKAQYGILRFKKYKGPAISPIEAHNERTKEQYASNPDIDTSWSRYNLQRTSSVKKCTFYGQGWTSGSMPTKPRTLRPPGR